MKEFKNKRVFRFVLFFLNTVQYKKETTGQDKNVHVTGAYCVVQTRYWSLREENPGFNFTNIHVRKMVL